MLGRIPYKNVVAVVFVLGLFMDLLDTTIVNVALPTLARDFAASPTVIEWVVTSYLLSLAVAIPVSGWAGDRFGTKRVFILALALFTLGSLLAALAWNIQSLIVFRALQGAGGGMLTPVGTAMAFRAFPPAERAQLASILTIPIAVAPATGPVLGGYLVEFHDWRWIFLINIPVGILGLIVAGFLLREHREARPGHLDLPGFLISTAGLVSLLYALAEAGSRGLDDSQVILLALLGLALLALFTMVELRRSEPMIDIRLLGNKLFAASNAVQMIGFAASMGALFLLPLLLQAEMGLSPLESGLTTFPQALGLGLMAPVAGRLYGRVGPSRLMMTGLAGVALTSFAFLLVDLHTARWWISFVVFLRGLSFALMLVPLQATTFATIRSEDTGRASAIFNASRQVSASFGVALLATVLTNRLSHHNAVLGLAQTRDGALLAFHDAFIAAGIIALIGVAVALLISDKEAAVSMRRVVPGHDDDLASEDDPRSCVGDLTPRIILENNRNINPQKT